MFNFINRSFPDWWGGNRIVVLFLAMGIGLTTLAWRKQRERIIYLWQNYRKEFLQNTFYQFLISLVTSLFFYLVLFRTGAIKLPINQKLIEERLKNGNGRIMMIFSVLILAPIIEEVIFRWLIFELFGNNFLSIIVSSLAFGLAHWHGESNFFWLFYILISFSFAYLYYKSNCNLIYPITAHFVNNLVALIFLIIKFSDERIFLIKI